MGWQYKCKKCGNETFKVFLNIYSQVIIAKPHAEIVCSKCDYGVVFKEEDWFRRSPKKREEE